jgi:hypothetical protein
LAGPLQEPNDWLTLAGWLVFFTVVALLGYRRYLHSLLPGAARNVVLALFACGMLAVAAGQAIQNLVTGPTNNAVSKWFDSQWHTLYTHNCPSSAFDALLHTETMEKPRS